MATVTPTETSTGAITATNTPPVTASTTAPQVGGINPNGTVQPAGSSVTQALQPAPAVITAQAGQQAINKIGAKNDQNAADLLAQSAKNNAAKIAADQADAAAYAARDKANADAADKAATDKMLAATASPGTTPPPTPTGPASTADIAKTASATNNIASSSKGFVDSSGNLVAPGSAKIFSYGGNQVTLGSDGQLYDIHSGAVVDTSTKAAAPDLSTQAGLDAAKAQQAADLTSANDDLQTKLNNLGAGVVALTPDQQGMIDAMKATFKQAHDAQLLANKNYEGGVTQAGISSGLQRYSPVIAMGEVQAAINSGIAKVASLDAENAKTIGQMRLAYEQQNWDKAQKMFDMQQKLTEDKNSAITKMLDDAQTHLDKVTEAATKAAQQKIENDRATAQDKYNQVQKPINDVSAELAKNGAPKSVVDAAAKAGNLADAIAAGVGYFQDPTSLGGMYAAYSRSQTAAGKKTMAPAEFVAAQKYAEALATQKAQSAYSYSDAYNAAAGRLAAESKFASSSSGQQKLEKEYTSDLIKTLSSRSGDLGVQNAKVSQAIHLKNLIDQNSKTVNGKTTYDLTPQQQSELAIGLANLLSGSSVAGEATISSVNTQTAAGDFAKAVQYVTGVPQKGNTDEVIQRLKDTIIQQGNQSEDLRDQYLQQFRATKPTDLSDDRAKVVEHILDFPSFKNPEKNVVAAANQAENNLKSYGETHPEKQAEITKNESVLAKTLGHTPSAVEFQEVYPEYFTQ